MNWIIDQVLSSSFIWHLNSKNFWIWCFLTRVIKKTQGREGPRKKKIYQEFRNIKWVAFHNHATYIHLCRMASNIWNLKIQKFSGLEDPSGKENWGSNFKERNLEKYVSESHASWTKILVKYSSQITCSLERFEF